MIDSIRRHEFQTEARAIPAEPSDLTAIRFVANGKPLPGHEVRIVDEEGELVAEREQGQLFFRGPSMTSGYYRNPKATAEIMTEGAWLDSGDLAYWANREIFVTGRRKDLIIKSGRNIIPQEVEAATADVAGVRRGCIAAFGSVDQAKYYLDLGVRHFCIGTDVSILFDWWKRNGDQMRQVLSEG